MKIYLASSWRNEHQPKVLAQLRAEGHEVYDFRNPTLDNQGFSWRQVIDRPIKTCADLVEALAHPVAATGFGYDFNAMKWADACVLLLPCGNSAHLEAGWFAGQGKPVAVFVPELREPELMYKCFDWLDKPNVGRSRAEWRTPLFDDFGKLARHLSSEEFVINKLACSLRDSRQLELLAWARTAFGNEETFSVAQRGIRLLEEAIEAAQAAAVSEEMAHKLVAYVFSRPVGALNQELGGVAVTLLLLAQAAGLSAEAEESREMERVLSKPTQGFAERNAAKNAAGFKAP